MMQRTEDEEATPAGGEQEKGVIDQPSTPVFLVWSDALGEGEGHPSSLQPERLLRAYHLLEATDVLKWDELHLVAPEESLGEIDALTDFHKRSYCQRVVAFSEGRGNDWQEERFGEHSESGMTTFIEMAEIAGRYVAAARTAVRFAINQGGKPSSETGTGSSEAGMGSSEAGLGSSEAGLGSSEAGMGSSEAGTGSSEAGTAALEAGTAALEVGMGSSEAGMGSSEAGLGSSEAGMGSSEAGTGSSQARLPIRVVSLAGTQPHARPAEGQSGGIFNDVALALLDAYVLGQKVAFINLDAEHPREIQQLFFTEPKVLTISLHEGLPVLYPSAGNVEQIGRNAGRGFNVNLPLPPGAGDKEMLRAFSEVVAPLLSRFTPDLVVLLAGSSAHFSERLAHLRLTSQGYQQLIEKIASIAPRLVLLGGGGTEWEVSRRLWALAIATLAGRKMMFESAGLRSKRLEGQPSPLIFASLAHDYDLRNRYQLHDPPLPALPESMQKYVTEIVDRGILKAQRQLFPLWNIPLSQEAEVVEEVDDLYSITEEQFQNKTLFKKGQAWLSDLTSDKQPSFHKIQITGDQEPPRIGEQRPRYAPNQGGASHRDEEVTTDDTRKRRRRHVKSRNRFSDKSEGGKHAREAGKSARQAGKHGGEAGSHTREGGQDTAEGGRNVRKGGRDARKGGRDARKGGRDARKEGRDARKGGRDARKGGRDARKGGRDAREAGRDAGEASRAAGDQKVGGAEKGSDKSDKPFVASDKDRRSPDGGAQKRRNRSTSDRSRRSRSRQRRKPRSSEKPISKKSDEEPSKEEGSINKRRRPRRKKRDQGK